MNVLGHLLSSDDRTIDSLVVAGLAGLLVFLGTAVYVVIQDYHTFSPITYGTGLATIIASLGGAKGARDYMTPMQTTMTSTPASTTMTQQPVHHDEGVH